MQIVIRLDLEESSPSLHEILKSAFSSGLTYETLRHPEFGASGEIKNKASRLIGSWEIEDSVSSEYSPNPRVQDYRQAAVARYARPREIEVDRFASVSVEEDGAFVQGWLFVPQADLNSSDATSRPASKPPQSVSLPKRAKSRHA